MYIIDLKPVYSVFQSDATHFESVVYTNFTTPASLGYRLSMLGIIRKLFGCARAKD